VDLDQLPDALAAAAERVRALGESLPDQAAQAILDAADPPRLSGALAATGRVEDGTVLYGGGVVDYAAPVHALQPWLDAAALAADDAVADLAERGLDTAMTL
jgi:hypothetical protein